MHVRHIFLSTGHSYFGNHGKPASVQPIVEVPEVECVTGQGLRGDRFYGFRPEYKGQVSFFALEIFEAVRREFKVPGLSPAAFRRNLITEGIDLNTLIGEKFTVQGVEFQGVGIKSAEFHHEYAGAEVAFDQAGHNSQLLGQVVSIRVTDLVFPFGVGLLNRGGIPEGCVGGLTDKSQFQFPGRVA